MNSADWSDELNDLERRLATRASTEPDPTLRERVLAAVRREVQAKEWYAFWNFVMGLAAVFLLGANLAMSSAPSLSSTVTDDPESVAMAAQRLHALIPEIPAEAAYAEVLMASSRSRLLMVPNMGAASPILDP
jgi:hypothetical protein